jgi:hypothetical protein
MIGAVSVAWSIRSMCDPDRGSTTCRPSASTRGDARSAPATGRPCASAGALGERSEAYGGDGAITELVSVAMQLSPDDAGTLVGALPRFFHLRVDVNKSHALTELLRGEIQQELGSVPIVRRLAEALFISAVRFYVEQIYVEQSGEAKHGLLAAIADPQLRRALGDLHDDLAKQLDLDAGGSTPGTRCVQAKPRLLPVVSAH